jgi:enoyl-[acyl-carrier protein] reductase II
MKSVIPVRLLKNDFFAQVEQAEAAGAGKEELIKLLGRGRAKLGMFEGNMAEGELEIGQVSSAISEIKPAAEILKNIWEDFLHRKEYISKLQV